MLDEAYRQLQSVVASGAWRYRSIGPNATEPAAFACLALCARSDYRLASPLVDWLAALQTNTGSVGITEDQQTPAWPTSLANLAWEAFDRGQGTATFEENKQRALSWAVGTQGRLMPRNEHIGHDTTIPGWSWAADTHAWLEPTCFHVLALKALGAGDHTRTRDGVRMIVDRLREEGGCNYGNTVVLGQCTLPHIQPTGIAMLAIADESGDDPRIERSLQYLDQHLDYQTATASLCFALLGLTAHDRRPTAAESLLARAHQRDTENGTLSCYKLALQCLAAHTDSAWLPCQEAHTQNTTQPA